MERTAYCDNCCKDTSYEIRDEIVNIDLKGQKFSYGAIVAYCKECQSEMSIDEINDLNIIRAYTAQKKALEKGS